MKFTYYLRGAVAMLVLVSTMPSCSQAQPSQTQKLSTEMDSVSYALGVLFATNMKSEGMLDINSEQLASGFSAVMNDNATLDPADADKIVREAMSAVKEKVSAAAKAEGEEFLAENAKKDGISVTESGLQYHHDTLGTGKSPDENDKVTVHYKGTLLDGTEFSTFLKNLLTEKDLIQADRSLLSQL